MGQQTTRTGIGEVEALIVPSPLYTIFPQKKSSIARRLMALVIAALEKINCSLIS